MNNEASSSLLERDTPSPALLDACAAAAYLAVYIETPYRLVRAGELPHARVGQSLRFCLVDLDHYLEEQTSTYWKKMDGRERPAKMEKAKGRL